MNPESTAAGRDRKEAVAAIPSCALTQGGRRAQRDRIQRLGASVGGFQRGQDCITIEFQADFDQRLLDEALAVERGCCPFFRFDFDEPGRRLTVSVEGPEHRAALDAIAHPLGVGRSL